jgi:TonB family protein
MRGCLIGLGFALVVATPVLAAETGHPAVITNPDWLKRPSLSELESVWPSDAHGAPGKAIISCVVTATGGVRDCTVVSESPSGKGFGQAALLLSASFVFKPGTVDGKPVDIRTTIPINWERSYGAMGPSYRMVTNLPWIKAPTMADVIEVYPKHALSKNLSGHVVIRCGLTRDGALKDCTPITEQPSGEGFGNAAVSLSKRFSTTVGKVSGSLLQSLRLDLPVQFAPPSSIPSVRMLANYDWTRQLDSKAVIDAFPGKAADAGLKTGRVVVDCTVAAGGDLTACTAVSEDPAGMDFGPSAVGVAQALAVNPWTQDGLPAEGAHLKFAIRFVRSEPEPAGTSTPSPPSPSTPAPSK